MILPVKNRLNKVFADSLGIAKSDIKDSLEYNTIPQWDSIGHMALVAAIEWEFDVMLDTDEILDMSSVKKVKDILLKHGVEF